ncbi:MAG TPA: ABC transporter substrate-binding protein [Actinomycetota bacterium]|nr:ABC transporter substrate-binding protein [Actinomycetota bacterium]
MRARVAILIAAAMLAGACTSNSQGSSGGPVKVLLWHGYEGQEKRSLDALVAEFNKTHPDIHVQAEFNAVNDHALQKVLTAVVGGVYPDISYLYGSWSANIQHSPITVPLNQFVKESSMNWNDFFPGERAAATVNGKIVGVPALVDNLAIVYNKKLFKDAGISYPTPDWTWDDFRAAASALTDASKQQFGWAYPADSTEDTVWHWEAMLWEAGGAILTPDNSRAAFDSPAGIKALTMLQDMAQDHSIYLDTTNTKIDQLFNSGKIGMVVTGPWALPSYPNVDYGTQIMPSFGGLNHQSIAGPDNWVIFNNGAERQKAAFEFVSWLTAPKQELKDSLATGHLPLRASVKRLPGYAQFPKKFSGISTFVNNLANVKQARPAVVAYPKISEALGQAIVSVLLGKSDARTALSQAAQQANAILAGQG